MRGCARLLFGVCCACVRRVGCVAKRPLIVTLLRVDAERTHERCEANDVAVCRPTHTMGGGR